MKKIKINHLDLFSGIGGFHLGFEKAGFEVNTYFSEIDKYAIDVYKNNFKNSTYVGSVTDVRATQLPKIDAITFGSPCQDFSLAGKRKGMGGDRSSLITEAIRLIDECRPRFFIWENVKGTFSSNNGEDFWAIIQAFTNIGGYRLEWQLLNTKWFLPQNRERIYLVGYLGDGSRGQVLPIGKGFEKDDNKIKLYGDTNKGSQRGAIYKTNGIMGCLTSTYYKQPKQIKVEVGTLRTHNDGKGFRKIKDGDCPTIPARAREDGSGQPIIKIKSATSKGYEEAVNGDNKTEQQIEINKKGTTNTLTAVTKDNLVINDKIRRLTPIECERLQGFPDNWTQYGESGKISDTQRYKMCGNAVTVDVVEAVAKSIIKSIY
tara:strand:- start:98 stop:1219 length:1122 start_codon:yes stop_codon:yes gene_type:complete